MENLIKWTLTSWRHYNLLRSLVGTVLNNTKLRLINRYIYIQYMWAINLIGENVINDSVTAFHCMEIRWCMGPMICPT